MLGGPSKNKAQKISILNHIYCSKKRGLVNILVTFDSADHAYRIMCIHT
jgi:hypothetical protein